MSITTSTKPAISEKQVITELLQQYKEYPCLWNTTDLLYNSVEDRKQAYGVLLEIYKQLIEDATMDSVKKKIDNLRASYRRESKKVIKDRSHRPSLWYYNLLAFLDEGKTIAEYKSENDYDEEKSEAGETFHAVFCPDEAYSEVKTSSFEQEENRYIIKTDQMLETDAYGRVVGLQLNELTTMQKTIAEKLISDIVYYARLDKLTTKTTLSNLLDDY